MLQILLGAFAPLIDRLVGLIPNENDRAKAREDLEREVFSAATAAAAAQTDINKIEAASSSLFVAGWRPAVGWVCTVGLAWTYVVQPIAVWSVVTFQIRTATPPVLDNESLMSLLFALLGIGTLRTFEKVKGVAR